MAWLAIDIIDNPIHANIDTITLLLKRLSKRLLKRHTKETPQKGGRYAYSYS